MEDHRGGGWHAVATGDADAYTEEVVDVVRRSWAVRRRRPASD
jgi:hypothetical protein